MQLVRYLSLSQLIYLVSKGLFIPKASLFEDHWEGLHKRYDFEDYSKFIEYKQKVAKAREWTYISCWHKIEDSFDESYAMWKLYGNHDETVAVATEVDSLIRSFQMFDGHGRTYGKINYVNYQPGRTLYPKSLYQTSSNNCKLQEDEEYISIFEDFFIKEKAYEYEKEVRLVFAGHPEAGIHEANPLQGIILPFKPDNLTQVIVSPFSNEWLPEVVEDIIVKYGLKVEVSFSHLEPYE